MEKQVIHQGIASGFGALAGAFVAESIQHLLPWLMVSFAVIICDLVVGIRKSLIMGEEVRFSRAVRATLGKCVSYFAFVVMVCMIDVAAGGEKLIDKWACLLVCFIEGTSIISNILRPKGIDVNLVKMIAIVFSKKFDVSKADIEEVIEKKDEKH